MGKNEFYQWFVEQVKERWPRWAVGPHELDDWYSVFGRYEAAILSEAVRRHRVFDDPSRPSTKRLLAIVRELLPRTAVPKAKPEPADMKFHVAWIRQNMAKLYAWEKRLKLMKIAVKIRASDPRRHDPQAYDWLLEKGLIPKPDESEQQPAAAGADPKAVYQHVKNIIGNKTNAAKQRRDDTDHSGA
jgi:hypothetical protein